MKNFDDTTFIIRSARERTEMVCKKLIISQGVDPGSIHTLHEFPFSKALEKSFETGIVEGKKWTFCIDADVLLRPDSIRNMLDFCINQPERVCQIQGYIMDKFFGGIRRGGVHIYRTSLLDKVLTRIPAEGVNIRPESHALREMQKNGFPYKIVPCLVGLHDSEQYNYDIYRKAFVQAVKHLSRAELFITLWKSNSSDDPDFKVALQGFSDSILHTEPVFINSELDLYKKLFEESGIREKEELDSDKFTLETVENIITNWVYSDIYYSFFPDKDGFDAEMKGYVRKFRNNYRRKGLLKSVRKAAGELFVRMGKKIR